MKNNVIIAIAGFGIGSILGYFIGKDQGRKETAKKYEDLVDMLDKIIEENEELYKEKRKENEKEEAEESDGVSEDEETEGEEKPKPEKESTKYYNSSGLKPRDYRRSYDRENTTAGVDPAEKEHPEEDDDTDESDDDIDEDSLEFEAYKEHMRNKVVPPQIITSEELGDVPAYYDEEVWMYYTENNVFATEDDIVIDDPERYFGECIERSHFKTNREAIIYIVNFELTTIYELHKVRDSFDYGDE